MTVVISINEPSCCGCVYRRLNHHGPLISKRSNDVQREHRATGIQASERCLHRDQNACPSNPSTGRRKDERHNTECTAGSGGAGYAGRLWCWVCVRYLQCTISGSSALLLSLMEVVNSRKSEGSSGTPWSGHATYCRCVTARSSPR